MNYLSLLRRVVVTFAVGVVAATAAVIAATAGGGVAASYFPADLLTYSFIIFCDHQMPFMSRIVITR